LILSLEPDFLFLSPHSTSLLTRLLGYRVEIVGQPITNDHLTYNEQGYTNENNYINDNIEDDVGIRDSTKLHIFRLVEHPVVVLFDYDTLLQSSIDNLINDLVADSTVKGYYVRTPSCDGNRNSVIDTGFLVIKPSLEEFNNIREGYINTPYDPELGWNSEGHNHCPGKLGLPGFLSYYFSITPGYIELDRCQYSFIADDECINSQLAAIAKPASEIANIVENGFTVTPPSTPEADAVNEAVKAAAVPVDQVRVLAADAVNTDYTTTISTETYMTTTITVVYLYVQVITSFVQVSKTTTTDGVLSTEVTLANNFTTTKTIIDEVAINPGIIDFADFVPDAAAESLISCACMRPAVAKKSVEVCGEPTDCPPDKPEWSRKQKLACRRLHRKYFKDKRRTEMGMNKDRKCDLQGNFKRESFLGYCKASGPENYLGLKDAEVEDKADWQVSVFVSHAEDCFCLDSSPHQCIFTLCL